MLGRHVSRGLRRIGRAHQGRPHRQDLLERLRPLRRSVSPRARGLVRPGLRCRADRHHGQRGVREPRQHRHQGCRSPRADRRSGRPQRDGLVDRRRGLPRGLLQGRFGRVRERARDGRRAHEDGHHRRRYGDHVEDRRPRGASLRLHHAGAHRAGHPGLGAASAISVRSRSSVLLAPSDVPRARARRREPAGRIPRTARAVSKPTSTAPRTCRWRRR